MSRSRIFYIAALVIGWAGLWFGRQLPHVAPKDLKPINRAVAASPQVEAIDSLPPPIEVEKIR